MMDARLLRYFGVAAILGGVLWIVYGVFEMLQPWGTDTVYRDNLGYEVVTDTTLFVVYSLPGSLALFLTSLGLLGVVRSLRIPTRRVGRVGSILGYVAAMLAIISAAGVVVLFDPVFTASRIFGTLALGVATLLVGADAHQQGISRHWTLTLLSLGVLGIFLLPLWPLVNAVQWLPEVAGAMIIAVFGVGWLVVGYRSFVKTQESHSVVQ